MLNKALAYASQKKQKWAAVQKKFVVSEYDPFDKNFQPSNPLAQYFPGVVDTCNVDVHSDGRRVGAVKLTFTFTEDSYFDSLTPGGREYFFKYVELSATPEGVVCCARAPYIDIDNLGECEFIKKYASIISESIKFELVK